LACIFRRELGILQYQVCVKLKKLKSFFFFSEKGFQTLHKKERERKKHEEIALFVLRKRKSKRKELSCKIIFCSPSTKSAKSMFFKIPLDI